MSLARRIQRNMWKLGARGLRWRPFPPARRPRHWNLGNGKWVRKP